MATSKHVKFNDLPPTQDTDTHASDRSHDLSDFELCACPASEPCETFLLVRLIIIIIIIIITIIKWIISCPLVLIQKGLFCSLANKNRKKTKKQFSPTGHFTGQPFRKLEYR
ncbi:hypothetical protein IscW_ISCW004354 [Ixodes scapularis]|uniref:Uncharacterized protein n=1 Tax=Ixodes scapularis TaxID=6945 RepID=B7PH71_IXOSC|nr:hypothetical protein IscW_ISCW004354 [Ixodes scapularis]|eukprot:XP_002402271.1 hypothetical protein IscW_ISCW004354 [Ixodes scapularis]